MKLTPLDIRKHEFARRFRGYDPEEVRPFMEMISHQWEELQDEVRHAQDRVREMENKIAHYEKVEVALQEALEAAKASAVRTHAHAEERARLTLEDAELKAEQILREAEQERFRLRQDVSKLSHRHAEVTARLRHFLLSELEVLAQHEEERPIGFMKLIPAREAEALPAAPAAPAEHDQVASGEPPAAAHVPAPERQPEPAPEARQDESAAGTTYADLYSRATRRAEEVRPEPEHPEETADFEEEEPAWTLRSLVADQFDDDDAEQRPAASASEKEHIRRILEDLD